MAAPLPHHPAPLCRTTAGDELDAPRRRTGRPPRHRHERRAAQSGRAREPVRGAADAGAMSRSSWRVLGQGQWRRASRPQGLRSRPAGLPRVSRAPRRCRRDARRPWPLPWLMLLSLHWPLFSMLLSGCATTAPHPSALPSEPAARLAAVRANEERVRSLRARFSSVAHFADTERSADGVLLVVKPDRFRLRLMLSFGITVFDYLNVGEQSWTTLPLAGEEARERADQFAPFSRDDLGQVFMRGAYAFPGECDAVPAPKDQVWVSCRDGTVLRRTLLIGIDGIVEEVSYDAGVQRLVIRYSDYRLVDGTVLPFRITLEYPQRRQSVDITIERYEVNPPLSDELFRPLQA